MIETTTSDSIRVNPEQSAVPVPLTDREKHRYGLPSSEICQGVLRESAASGVSPLFPALGHILRYGTMKILAGTF